MHTYRTDGESELIKVIEERKSGKSDGRDRGTAGREDGGGSGSHALTFSSFASIPPLILSDSFGSKRRFSQHRSSQANTEKEQQMKIANNSKNRSFRF